MVPAERPSHMLIWVRAGRARVLLDGGTEFSLAGGEGIWTPQSYRNRALTITEPGTVAFPYWLDAGVGAWAPTKPTRFDVPDDWQDWLIQYFNLQVTPFTGHGYSPDGVADLLRGFDPRPTSSLRGGATTPSALFDPPTMPKAAGARAVAEELIRDPALDLTLKEWATRVPSSPRTLLREFLADTGLTFEQWRLRCRLTAAVEFLAAGYDVDQVAARVGFASRGGFRRAFQQQFGPTPHEFARELAAHALTGGLTGRAGTARQADNFVRLMRRGGAAAHAPDLLPAARTPLHTMDSHVLSWMYRGSGYLDIGLRRYERPRGVATWIPAGVEHITGLRQDSISLPLGNASTADLQLIEPIQVQFPRAWDDYLMFSSISARTSLRPVDYDPTRIIDLFAEQVAAQRALSVPMPTDPRGREAAMDYLRRIGVSAGATDFDLPADVHRLFHEQTGMTFARWRYAARMRMARDLLVGGAKPSSVAHRVGYAHLPTFSAAFTRFHGLSPREYQEREIGTA
ncbi:AraC-type DNA-binding protein [Parafrankia irregularis]|uniref:AraC-type DNA-binding protein n=2 Tax=Frankiaceae TaxID=74712 RepID=A0A0S4QUZ6_9ACTN|nr:AraC family transcriptional regulator [Parafrankia sp. CH37]CUU59424.1 AraC-type DNA-binding protein [Parafrankia irregularis]